MIDDEVDRVALVGAHRIRQRQSQRGICSPPISTRSSTARVATSEALVGLRELERDVQASRAVYQRSWCAPARPASRSGSTPRISAIISKADLPLRAARRRRTRILALGAVLLGLAAGTGIVLLRDAVRRHAGAAACHAAAGRRSENAAKNDRGSDRPVRRQPAIPVLAVLPGVDISFGLDAVG